MPTYEYRCRACGKKSSKLFRSFSEVADIPCPHCGKSALKRLISKPMVIRKSGGGGDDDFGEEAGADFNDEDPRAMARMARGMANEMGEELPAGYSELLGRMEAGEMPDDEDFAGLDEPDDAEGDL